MVSLSFTFALVAFLNLVYGKYGSDMDTVQNRQQDLSQPQQITEVVEAKIYEVASQIHNLKIAKKQKGLNWCHIQLL